MVGSVGVETLFDGESRDAQSAPAFCRLDGLEVQPIYRVRTYEHFDLGDDLRVKGFFEAPFFATSFAAALGACNWASAHSSQTVQ